MTTTSFSNLTQSYSNIVQQNFEAVQHSQQTERVQLEPINPIAHRYTRTQDASQYGKRCPYLRLVNAIKNFVQKIFYDIQNFFSRRVFGLNGRDYGQFEEIAIIGTDRRHANLHRRNISQINTDTDSSSEVERHRERVEAEEKHLRAFIETFESSMLIFIKEKLNEFSRETIKESILQRLISEDQIDQLEFDKIASREADQVINDLIERCRPVIEGYGEKLTKLVEGHEYQDLFDDILGLTADHLSIQVKLEKETEKYLESAIQATHLAHLHEEEFKAIEEEFKQMDDLDRNDPAFDAQRFTVLSERYERQVIIREVAKTVDSKAAQIRTWVEKYIKVNQAYKEIQETQHSSNFDEEAYTTIKEEWDRFEAIKETIQTNTGLRISLKNLDWLNNLTFIEEKYMYVKNNSEETIDEEAERTYHEEFLSVFNVISGSYPESDEDRKIRLRSWAENFAMQRILIDDPFIHPTVHGIEDMKNNPIYASYTPENLQSKTLDYMIQKLLVLVIGNPQEVRQRIQAKIEAGYEGHPLSLEQEVYEEVALEKLADLLNDLPGEVVEVISKGEIKEKHLNRFQGKTLGESANWIIYSKIFDAVEEIFPLLTPEAALKNMCTNSLLPIMQQQMLGAFGKFFIQLNPAPFMEQLYQLAEKDQVVRLLNKQLSEITPEQSEYENLIREKQDYILQRDIEINAIIDTLIPRLEEHTDIDIFGVENVKRALADMVESLCKGINKELITVEEEQEGETLTINESLVENALMNVFKGEPAEYTTPIYREMILDSLLFKLGGFKQIMERSLGRFSGVVEKGIDLFSGSIDRIISDSLHSVADSPNLLLESGTATLEKTFFNKLPKEESKQKPPERSMEQEIEKTARLMHDFILTLTEQKVSEGTGFFGWAGKKAWNWFGKGKTETLLTPSNIEDTLTNIFEKLFKQDALNKNFLLKISDLFIGHFSASSSKLPIKETKDIQFVPIREKAYYKMKNGLLVEIVKKEEV